MAEMSGRLVSGEKTAGHEPFNPPRVTVTRPTQEILNRAQTRMLGLPGHPNPGAVPNLGSFIKIIDDSMRVVRGVQIINEAICALIEESKKLECRKSFDYHIFYGTKPSEFKSIAPRNRDILISTDTEVVNTTIIGTNCPQYQLPLPEWQQETFKNILKEQTHKNNNEPHK